MNALTSQPSSLCLFFRMFSRWMLALVFLAGTQVHAQTAGDDFNDNSKDPAKWGTDLSPAAPGGQLVETNGRLEYYSTGGGEVTFRPWVYNYGSYTQDWETVVDLNIGNFVLPQDNSDVQMSLEIMKKDGFSSRTVFGIGLMLWRIDASHIGRVIRSTLSTNGVGAMEIEINTTALNVSVRVTFNSADKTLTAWFDEDGSANGYSWTSLSSGRIDNAGWTWGMTNNSLFQAYLSGNSENFAVNSSHQVFADNFLMYASVVPSPPILKINWSSSVPNLSITGDIGRRYALDYVTKLSATNNWQSVATNMLTSNPLTVADTTVGGDVKRFYRARLVP